MIALGWLASVAGAVDCSDGLPLAADPGVATAEGAIDQLARYWAAAAVVERDIFPYAVRPSWEPHAPFYGRIVVDSYYLADLDRVAVSGAGPDCPWGLGAHPVDAAVGSLAFAQVYPSGIGIVFGASSLLAGPIDSTRERWVTGLATTPWLVAHAPFATFWDPKPEGLWTHSGDLLLGGMFDGGRYGTWRLAWSRRAGWATNLSHEQLRLLVSALVSPQLDALPFLRAGFDRIVTPAGQSSALFRKQPGGPAPVAGDAPSDEHQGLVLRQDAIGGLLDLGLEPAWRPNVRLAQSRIALHTRGFHELPVFYQSPEEAPWDLREGGEVELAIEGGHLDLPPLPWYGVDGGLEPYGVLVMRVNVARASDRTVARVDYRMAYNDPEVLTTLPMAQGSWRVGLRLIVHQM